MLTRSMTGSSKPRVLNINVNNHDSAEDIPKLASAALLVPHRKEAAQEQFKALMRTHTWTLVPKPENAKIIGCK